MLKERGIGKLVEVIEKSPNEQTVKSVIYSYTHLMSPIFILIEYMLISGSDRKVTKGTNREKCDRLI